MLAPTHGTCALTRAVEAAGETDLEGKCFTSKDGTLCLVIGVKLPGICVYPVLSYL